MASRNDASVKLFDNQDVVANNFSAPTLLLGFNHFSVTLVLQSGNASWTSGSFKLQASDFGFGMQHPVVVPASTEWVDIPASTQAYTIGTNAPIAWNTSNWASKWLRIVAVSPVGTSPKFTAWCTKRAAYEQ